MLGLPLGFCHVLAGVSCPLGRGCKAEQLPGTWLVSPGCSCLPQDREQPAMGSPRIIDSPLPTPFLHGRTLGTGIWVTAVTYRQDIIDLWICTATSSLLWARAVTLPLCY